MAFKRERRSDGCYNYRSSDGLFLIVPSTRQTYGGAHGSTPIFGRMSSDGNVYVTGWTVRVEGSDKVFGVVSGKLADAKSKVEDPAWRSWALERAGL